MTGEKYFTVESLSAGIAIVWGIMTANPSVDTFAKNPKLYAPMIYLCPSEALWGVFFVLCGLTALVLNFKQKYYAALLMFVFFAFMATFFFIGDIESNAFGVYGLIAVFNLIHWRANRWITKT